MVNKIDIDGFYDLVHRVHKKVDYPYSNENIEAITNTLDIKRDDKIISICGSGAQPLALLQYLNGNGEILAVDSNKFQIKLAKDILDNIAACFYGRNNITLSLNISPRNKGYFLEMQRLGQIYKNRDKIDFKIMDVSKPSEIRKVNKKFTKGYFSNAEVNIMAFEDRFESGSLIYITSFPFQNILGDMVNEKTIEKSYAMDIERTKLAREIECTNTHLVHPDNNTNLGSWEWKPTVLVRI